MSEWKPGDLAMLSSVNGEAAIGFAVGVGEVTGWRTEDGALWGPRYTDLARPLVVIDLDDEEVVDRLRREVMGPLATASPLSEWQAALRSLLAPPRPEESTGLGAVVEAECTCNSGRQHFVRDPAIRDFTMRGGGDDTPWTARCGHHSWDVLSDITPLTEGWKP